MRHAVSVRTDYGELKDAIWVGVGSTYVVSLACICNKGIDQSKTLLSAFFAKAKKSSFLTKLKTAISLKSSQCIATFISLPSLSMHQ